MLGEGEMPFATMSLSAQSSILGGTTAHRASGRSSSSNRARTPSPSPGAKDGLSNGQPAILPSGSETPRKVLGPRYSRNICTTAAKRSFIVDVSPKRPALIEKYTSVSAESPGSSSVPICLRGFVERG